MPTTPPARAATYGIDTDNICKGAGNVCINGTPVGALDPDSEVILTPVSNDGDMDIKCLQYPGDILGRRQGGTVYKLQFEVIETPLWLVRAALDLSGVVASGGSLPLGVSNKVATLHQVQFFGEGPQQQTRRWTLHQAFSDRMGDIRIGAGNKPNSLKISMLVCRTFSFTAGFCYGLINDFA